MTREHLQSGKGPSHIVSIFFLQLAPQRNGRSRSGVSSGRIVERDAELVAGQVERRGRRAAGHGVESRRGGGGAVPDPQQQHERGRILGVQSPGADAIKLFTAVSFELS